MKVTLKFDEDKLLKECMENYPEASTPSIHCCIWNYKAMKFTFHDVEENKLYEVDIPKLRKGLKTLLALLSKNKLPGLNINLNNFLDTGEWDMWDLDALIQCTIFGEVPNSCSKSSCSWMI